MISISMCMIVKNEAAILERCLNSYKGIYDELIIVDTGSTDNTKEIASKYTDKIYDFEWTNDFSAARNYAFSKATCDYIFSADADEELDEANNKALLDIKSVLLPEIDIVQMYYVNANDLNSVYNTKRELRPKLFKRLRTFSWISPIHETVRLTPIVFDSDIEILHKPVCSHSKRDFSTYINAAGNNVTLENYVVNMLCKELLISGDDSDLLEFAEILNKLSKDSIRSNDVLQSINCVLVKIFRIKNDYNNFFKLALKSVADNPCSEICYELGNYYFDIKDYEEAILWYYNAAYETESILDITCSGKKPLCQLSKCYKLLATLTTDKEVSDNYINISNDYYDKSVNWEMPEE